MRRGVSVAVFGSECNNVVHPGVKKPVSTAGKVTTCYVGDSRDFSQLF